MEGIKEKKPEREHWVSVPTEAAVKETEATAEGLLSDLSDAKSIYEKTGEFSAGPATH